MGRSSSNSYLRPIKSDGTEAAAAGGDAAFATAFNSNNRGVFTLVASNTYYIPLGGADTAFLHATLQGDASIIITSATIEETDFAEHEAEWYSDVTGQWFATDAGRITSAAEGTGWTATSDVGATSGGNAGGVAWNIESHGARRTRIKIVVSTTGGEVRCAVWGKE